MDNLRDILGKKHFKAPNEIQIIKKFMADNYKSDANITIHPATIVITVTNAALAGTLRLHLYELAELCQTDKRLVIRIGR